MGSGAGMVGFVDSSSVRMAESRSDIVVEAPCMAVPPGIEILVVLGLWLLAGDVPREWAGVVFRDRAGDIEARTLCNAGSSRVGICFAAESENCVENSFLRDDDDGM